MQPCWVPHLGDVECISNTIREKTASLRIKWDRLSFLHAQDALPLLCHSFAIPKLLYTLRTAPCFLSHELRSYDDLLRSITSRIANVPFSESDPVWTQASFPVKQGGLGIWSAVQLACGGLNLYCGCSCVCLMIFVSCMLGFCSYHMVVTCILKIVTYVIVC